MSFAINCVRASSLSRRRVPAPASATCCVMTHNRNRSGVTQSPHRGSQGGTGGSKQARSCAGALMVAAHQLFLSAGGIDVAHAEARGPGLLSLNKEGLLSLPASNVLPLMLWMQRVI